MLLDLVIPALQLPLFDCYMLLQLNQLHLFIFQLLLFLSQAIKSGFFLLYRFFYPGEFALCLLKFSFVGR